MANDKEAMIDLSVPKCHKATPDAVMASFPMLLGEHPLVVASCGPGQVMVTHQRVCVAQRHAALSIPLMAVSDLDVNEASLRVKFGCKDGSTYCCTFASLADLRACQNVFRDRIGQPKRQQDIFAYRFFAAASQREAKGGPLSQAEAEQIALSKPVPKAFAYTFGKEVERLGFDTSRRRLWRMSHANDKFEFCPTYPKLHLLPATVSDDKLKLSLDFRALSRFPSVVWRDQSSGMVLIRSSQPLSSFLGVSYFSNDADLSLVEEIVKACNRDWEQIYAKQRRDLAAPPAEGGDSNGAMVEAMEEEDGARAQGGLVGQGGVASNGGAEPVGNERKLAIIDCRSVATVWGNSLKGGGTEDEALYKCKLVHLDLANIHCIRDSFRKMRDLCHSYSEGTFMRSLVGSHWLFYISQLLRGANIVVELIKVKRQPVLVHCSDGWDRTAQICSLSELLMDPYYRTIQGFQVLVEREWLHFGHKFAERGWHDPKSKDPHQASPIFLQFLDCVQQLVRQHPAEFQFNQAYLIKLLKHSQACLFGTFLFNCSRDRDAWAHKAASVWALLTSENPRWHNLLYKPSQEVLVARYCEHEVVLWQEVYMEANNWQHSTHLQHTALADPHMASEPLTRTRSMEDLHKVHGDSGRRLSDPLSSPSAAELHNNSDPHNTSTSSAEMLHLPDDMPKDIPRCVAVYATEKLSLPNGSPQLTNSRSPNGTLSEKEWPSLNGHSKEKGKPLNGHAPDKETVLNGNSQEKEIHLDDNSQEKETSENGKPAINHSCNGTLEKGSSPQEKPKETENVNNGNSETKENVNVGSIGLTNGFTGENLVQNGQSSLVSSDKDISILLESSNIPKESRQSSPPVPLKTFKSDGSHMTMSLLSERLAETQLNGDHPPHSNSASDPASQVVNGSNGHSVLNGHSNGNPKEETNGHHHSQADPDLIKDLDPQSSNQDGNLKYSPSENSSQENGHTHSKPTSPESQEAPTRPQRRSQEHLKPLSVSTDNLTLSPSSSSTSSSATLCSKHTSTQVNSHSDIFTNSVSSPRPRHHSSTSSITSPLKKDILYDSSNGNNMQSRRARAASGASRDLSISPSAGNGNWTDTGRLRHLSGSDVALRRCVRSSMSTSTTDISDSFVGQMPSPSPTGPHRLRQHLDTDGLTLTPDPAGDLLAGLLASKDTRIQELEAQLAAASEMMRKVKAMQAPQPPGDDTSDSEEPLSLGATSTSLDSWEALEEGEARVVPWVPDHTVTHCAACDSCFWMGKWKHHCRNCGKVFCDECSQYRAPVSHAHLSMPERVCRRCHNTLIQLSPGAASDGRIPTLVADG